MIIIIVQFILIDPFKIIYHYDNFYADHMGPHVNINRDYASTEIYLKNREKSKYNAFVFGSSRSLAFWCKDWEQYIEGGVPFHFDSSAESIYDIWTKIRYIDDIRDTVRYALIIMDTENLEIKNHKGHLYVKHPITSDNSWLSFYLTFIKAYFSDNFFVKFTLLKCIKNLNYEISAEGLPIDNIILEFTPITNDLYLKDFDYQISTNPDQYYHERKNIFFPQEESKQISNAVIAEKQLTILNNIATVFQRHKTEYKMIISPLYDQIYINENDIKILQSIFGKDNVFDYSGINKFTNELHNYYETSHYRPCVAREILKEIY